MLIPFVLALNTFFTEYQGWRFLLPILADPKRRRAAHWIDLGVLALHYAVWIALPMLYFSPGRVIAFYVLRNVLMGYAMFAGFAPAHAGVALAYYMLSTQDLPPAEAMRVSADPG